MIKMLVMDVDGTMTDGGLYYDNCGNEFKKFNVKDGYGIKRLILSGIKTMVLTGKKSCCVERRSKELGIDYLIQGMDDKEIFLMEFLKENGMGFNEIAYIGDDLNDIECIKKSKVTACPNDAAKEVKDVVSYICNSRGGEGAIREFVDYLLYDEKERRGI